MRKVSNDTFEVRLYIGSQAGYGGEVYGVERLRELIQVQQGTDERAIIPVRISPTQFVAGEYVEEGWEVAAINYPRRPKKFSEIYAFMEGLARHLMVTLNQKRVSLVTPETTVMLENNLMPD